MTLSITINDTSDDFARSLATEVREQHDLQAFAKVDEVSMWMHDRFQNPRLKIKTNEEGTQITVTYEGSVILTINVA